jgi:hypothetical protein
MIAEKAPRRAWNPDPLVCAPVGAGLLNRKLLRSATPSAVNAQEPLPAEFSGHTASIVK